MLLRGLLSHQSSALVNPQFSVPGIREHTGSRMARHGEKTNRGRKTASNVGEHQLLDSNGSHFLPSTSRFPGMNGVGLERWNPPDEGLLPSAMEEDRWILVESDAEGSDASSDDRRFNDIDTTHAIDATEGADFSSQAAADFKDMFALIQGQHMSGFHAAELQQRPGMEVCHSFRRCSGESCCPSQARNGSGSGPK